MCIQHASISHTHTPSWAKTGFTVSIALNNHVFCLFPTKNTRRFAFHRCALPLVGSTHLIFLRCSIVTMNICLSSTDFNLLSFEMHFAPSSQSKKYFFNQISMHSSLYTLDSTNVEKTMWKLPFHWFNFKTNQKEKLCKTRSDIWKTSLLTAKALCKSFRMEYVCRWATIELIDRWAANMFNINKAFKVNE